MAISTEVIRKITIQATAQGVDQTTAAVKGLTDAQTNLAVVSDTTAKRALSAEAAYNRQTLSVVAGARAQADLEKATKVATAAFNQGVLGDTNSAAAKAALAQRIDLLKDKYGQLSSQQKAVGTVMQDLNGRVAAATGSLGTMGQVLTAFGPAGIAVAAVVGTVALALNGMADASHALAQKADELRRFSEVTGLTTQQVQALRSEASKFGVTGDEAAVAIEHFTASFNALRLGQGDLLTQIRRVNPALADQMQMTTNAGDALTLFGKILAQTDDVFQRNAMVKAAAGKGGLGTAQFLSGLNVDRLTQSFTDAGRGLDENLIKKLPQVEIEINKLKSSMGDAFTKQFAQPLLEVELSILRTIKAIGDAVASFKLSDDLKAFINFATMLPRMAINTAIDPAASFRPGRSTGPADLNDPTRRGAFQIPLRTSGMADLNDPLRGLPSTAKTPEAIAAGLKDVVALLGTAATFTEQYNAKIAELNTTENKAKLTEQERARALAGLSLDLAIQKTAALNGILGVAATVQDQYRARLQQIAKLQQEGAGATPAQIENAKRLAQAQADGTFQLQAQIDATKVQTATIGMSVAKAEEFSLIQTKINENLNAGRPALDGVTDAYRKMAAAAGVAKEAQEKASINQQIGRDRQTALLSSEDVQIANQLKSIYPDIATALNSAEAASIRWNNTLKTINDVARSSAATFGTDFVNGLRNGESAMTSLGKAATNLSNSLTSGAFNQLAQGNFISAGIMGIGAVISGIFGANQAKRDADNKAAQDALVRAQDYTNRVKLASVDTQTRAGALVAFDIQAAQQRADEAKNGNRAIVQLEQALAAERNKINTDFDAQAVAADKQAAADRLAAQEEINKRIRSAQDRLFNAQNDTTTLAGQLATFDRQAQRDREDEIAKGGAALVDLEAAQAAERYNVIRTYNDKIVADATATAKQVLDAQTKVATQIVDYLNNLNVGPESSLSPQDRLAAAQTTFNATSALAAGGNMDALDRFTKDAENLRKAAQDYYASGAGYQAILATIKSTATGLPVVSGSTDPLINAMLGVKTAVQATTTAVTTDTTQTSARLDQSINKLDVTADRMATSIDLLRSIGQQQANIATGWYGRMVDYLAGIQNNTGKVATYFSQFQVLPATPTQHDNPTWWNPLTWFQQGGVVGAYAPGGVVGNGLFNVDSVRARYAGGGDIALAGGEGIINAPRTRQLGGPAAIAMLNHGMMPGMTAANDNRDYTAQFDGLMRVSAAGSSGIIQALREEISALREEVARGNAANRLASNMRQRPGAPQAQKTA